MSRRLWLHGTRFAVVLAVACLGAIVACQKQAPPTPVADRGPEKGQTVILEPMGTPKPNPKVHECHLSHDNKPDEDHVRWRNDTGGPVTIHFKAGWPFLETQEDIKIAAGALSAYFSLDPAKNGSFEYEVNPPIEDQSGGPGDPSVSADP